MPRSPARRLVVKRVRASLLLGSAVLFGAGLIWDAGALEPGFTGAATATQDGWWNRLQGPVEGEPAGNPVRPLLPALPAAPPVPADTIVTSAVAGQVDKVAAVGLEVALPHGVHLDGLTLHLQESPAAGANVNPTEAKVLACPVTGRWTGHKNADWAARPQVDCSLGQAAGVRAGDGTWTFDLTPLAALWADPYAALSQNGVVLSVDPAASPSVAQVSWLDLGSGHVAVEFMGTMVSSMMGALIDVPSPPVSAESPSLVAPGEVPPAESGPLGAAGGSGPAFADPLAFPSGETVPVPRVEDQVTPGSEAAAPVLSPAQVAPAAAPRIRLRPQPIRNGPAAGFWNDLPTPAALLIPVVLGLALLMALTLGPSGRPQPVRKRAGGLSRALDRRRGGGRDAI